jgi:cell division protein FtsQ
MLPLSDKFSARLPVFTGFPSDKKVLTRADSALLREIYQVSVAIQKDPFRMAMIDQVDIDAQRNFEMMPKVGNTIIAFGDGKNAEEKFNKLVLFYKEIMKKAGWNRYSMVDVRYKGQVVAKRKDRAEIIADSVHTLQLMQTIAYNAEQMASSDSLQIVAQDNERNTPDVSIIEQSIQRDDNSDSAENASILKPQGIPVTSTVLSNPVPMKNPGAVNDKKVATTKTHAAAGTTQKTALAKPAKPAATKPVHQTTTENKPKPTKPAAQKPKAVMPAKNDY